jgi:hypothetical protein
LNEKVNETMIESIILRKRGCLFLSYHYILLYVIFLPKNRRFLRVTAYNTLLYAHYTQKGTGEPVPLRSEKFESLRYERF